MAADEYAPAWSEPFLGEARERLARGRAVASVDRDAAWGGSTGQGVRVAIIDSGVEPDHPAVGGRLVQSLRVDLEGDEPRVVEDEDRVDVVGHGTACAGIIHGLAPDAELVSLRVLGPDNRGKGIAFAYALDWVVEHRIEVTNMSLSSRSEDLFGTFHDLADQAYFARCLLVCAASNTVGQRSYPSLFSSVLSVAAHDVADPLTFFYNPTPPVEFGAWGVDVPVAWKGGGSMIATGNSFATPHMAGIAALVRAKWPDLAPFEVKAVLAAVSSNPREPG